MPEGRKAECTERMMDGEMMKICYCQEAACNLSLKACLRANKIENCTHPATTTVQTTGGTSKNDQNSTENDALGTSKVDQNPTEDSTTATGEGNQQSTGDGAEATTENVKETQKPTGKPAATSGNQRVVESNQFGFDLWILAIIVIKFL